MRLLCATVMLNFDLELDPESERWDDQDVRPLKVLRQRGPLTVARPI